LGKRLGKRDVEALLDRYDDDPVAALEVALRRLLDRSRASFDELVQAMDDEHRLSVERRRALLDRDPHALDALAAELNETRGLPS
jgi:hypothetical protein